MFSRYGYHLFQYLNAHLRFIRRRIGGNQVVHFPPTLLEYEGVVHRVVLGGYALKNVAYDGAALEIQSLDQDRDVLLYLRLFVRVKMLIKCVAPPRPLGLGFVHGRLESADDGRDGPRHSVRTEVVTHLGENIAGSKQ